MNRENLKITLEAARVNAHLTQEEAANILGVSRATIQSWEKSRTAPSVLQVEKISQAYNWPSDAIIF